jgi:hypothetical protein
MPRISPPNCEKCTTLMRELAYLPPISPGAREASVFRCEPCKFNKWVEGLMPLAS